MALKATATKATRYFVPQNLYINCSVIQKLPNVLNIKYIVQPKPDDALSCTIDNVAENGVAAERTVVSC